MRQFQIYTFLCIFLFSGCNNKTKVIYIDTDYSSTQIVEDADDARLFTDTDTNEIIVPYYEQGGVKIIAVEVNEIKLDMIFDTGCSGTLISIAEANYLYQKDLLKIEDILGTSRSLIADGSIVENTVINLRKVVIADKIICSNVRAIVSDNISAPLLLGNEVLNRAASYTIDNESKTIVFKLKQK